MRIDCKSNKIFLSKADDGEDCEILNEMEENAFVESQNYSYLTHQVTVKP